MTDAIEGQLIPPGIDVERALWSIWRGEFSDARYIGAFAGTEAEVSALIAEANESRREVDEYDGAVTYRGSEYWAEVAPVIRTVADLTGH